MAFLTIAFPAFDRAATPPWSACIGGGGQADAASSIAPQPAPAHRPPRRRSHWPARAHGQLGQQVQLDAAAGTQTEGWDLVIRELALQGLSVQADTVAPEAVAGSEDGERAVGRRSIPQAERMRVWVRSGGRCAICGRYLLEGKLTHKDFSLGELAHIVGQQTTEGSPRGDYDLPESERDKAGNLMLLCASEHDEIDRDGALDIMTVERLRRIKHGHEDWVRRMTGLDRNRGTAVVRMIGAVRGNAVELSKPTASAAVLNSDDRFPEFPLSYEQYGFEIDLRHLPGEGTEMYWTTAKAAIDEVIAHKLKEAVRREDVRHLSVFGFARLPLLVYLGSRLDDTYEVAIYQRHRSTEAWAWPEGTATVEFMVESQPADEPADGAPPAGAVLVLNISGTIQPDELPPALTTLPRLVVTPVGETPGVDIIRSPVALDTFTRTIRTLLSQLEVTDKHLPALHVFAALPVSASVALGRARDPHVHPPFVIYDRIDTGYVPALEIS